MKLKLRHKILLLFISASLCILIVLGSFLSSALRNMIITTISQNYRKQLEHIDFGLTDFFRNIEQDLEAIAQNEWVRSRNDENFTNFLQADEKTFQYNIGDIEHTPCAGEVCLVARQQTVPRARYHTLLQGFVEAERAHGRDREPSLVPRQSCS